MTVEPFRVTMTHAIGTVIVHPDPVPVKGKGCQGMERSIFRVLKDRANPYCIVNKGFVEDDGLSWKAKGIMLYLLSRPDDWRVLIADLVNRSTDGRESVYSGIRELIRHGYIVRDVQRNQDGKIVRHQYVVHEAKKPEPEASSPQTGFPDMANQDMANPPLLSNKGLLNTELKKKAFHPDRVDLPVEPNRGSWYRGSGSAPGCYASGAVPNKGNFSQRQYTDAELEALCT